MRAAAGGGRGGAGSEGRVGEGGGGGAGRGALPAGVTEERLQCAPPTSAYGP